MRAFRGLPARFSFLIAASVLAWWLLVSRHRPAPLGNPECAHWATLRICEMFGAPVGMEAILSRMPPTSRGNSMADIAEVLNDVGLHCSGVRHQRHVHEFRSFPCIAHVRQQDDHFVVVAGISGEHVHLFDGLGHRTSWTVRDFQDRWSGNTLYINKDSNVTVIPKWNNDIAGPRIQFDTLFVDQGNIPCFSTELHFRPSGSCG